MRLSRKLHDEAILEPRKMDYLVLGDLSDDSILLKMADKKAPLYMAGNPRHLIYLK
jgi:hypothetical protein